MCYTPRACDSPHNLEWLLLFICWPSTPGVVFIVFPLGKGNKHAEKTQNAVGGFEEKRKRYAFFFLPRTHKCPWAPYLTWSERRANNKVLNFVGEAQGSFHARRAMQASECCTFIVRSGHWTDHGHTLSRFCYCCGIVMRNAQSWGKLALSWY